MGMEMGIKKRDMTQRNLWLSKSVSLFIFQSFSGKSRRGREKKQTDVTKCSDRIKIYCTVYDNNFTNR